MKSKMKIHTKITKKHTIELTGSDIVELLRHRGVIPNIPTCDVKFYVPGGGDWSNMDIDIDNDNPIKVSYTTTSTENIDD